MKRLLVIEDHAWVLQALCGALRRNGFASESATTLREARRRVLGDDPYDAIVCEHQLSDGSAMEFLGWLRWQQHISVPFLLIARNKEFARRHASNFTVLSMPVREDRLLASLNALLQDETEGMLICQIPFAAEME